MQAWLDRYVDAWRANERKPIEEIFTEDAVYSYRPWDEDRFTWRGRLVIVDHWLEEPDAPASWAAQYEPWVVDGDRAVAVGWSRYAAADDAPERLYHNAFLLDFGPDGRCRSFREFYMEREAG